MSKTWVAVSASTTRDYNFMLPIAALFWRDLIGFEPLCICIGDWYAARPMIALDALDAHRLMRRHIPGLAGYDHGTVAQNVRQHASVDPCMAAEDWMLPSDADLLPLRASWYKRHLETTALAVLYFSNGDHFVSKDDVLTRVKQGKTDYQSIPTCHVAMRVAEWRECYSLNAGDDLCAVTKRTLDAWLPSRMQGKAPNWAAFEAWMSDQRMLTERLCSAEWFPGRTIMIPRAGHPPPDRLDRSDPMAWDKADLPSLIDAHVLRPPDNDANWPRIRKLIAHFLPQHLAWADDYQERYRTSYVD